MLGSFACKEEIEILAVSPDKLPDALDSISKRAKGSGLTAHLLFSDPWYCVLSVGTNEIYRGPIPHLVETVIKNILQNYDNLLPEDFVKVSIEHKKELLVAIKISFNLSNCLTRTDLESSQNRVVQKNKSEDNFFARAIGGGLEEDVAGNTRTFYADLKRQYQMSCTGEETSKKIHDFFRKVFEGKDEEYVTQKVSEIAGFYCQPMQSFIFQAISLFAQETFDKELIFSPSEVEVEGKTAERILVFYENQEGFFFKTTYFVHNLILKGMVTGETAALSPREYQLPPLILQAIYKFVPQKGFLLERIEYAGNPAFALAFQVIIMEGNLNKAFSYMCNQNNENIIPFDSRITKLLEYQFFLLKIVHELETKESQNITMLLPPAKLDKWIQSFRDWSERVRYLIKLEEHRHAPRKRSYSSPELPRHPLVKTDKSPQSKPQTPSQPVNPPASKDSWGVSSFIGRFYNRSPSPTRPGGRSLSPSARSASPVLDRSTVDLQPMPVSAPAEIVAPPAQQQPMPVSTLIENTPPSSPTTTRFKIPSLPPGHVSGGTFSPGAQRKPRPLWRSEEMPKFQTPNTKGGHP